MNVELLRKIQKHILAEPLRYNQNATIARGDPGGEVCMDVGDVEVQKAPTCGTIGCLAGWAHLLSIPENKRVNAKFSYAKARAALGLTLQEAQRLFSYVYSYSPGVWPERFVAAYRNAKTARQRARVAVQRIDHFIKTKGAE